MEIYTEAFNEEEAPPPSYDSVVATQWLICMCFKVATSSVLSKKFHFLNFLLTFSD
jgi:hypothetical protein